MCTTMRKLRRGTEQGKLLKMAKRNITRRIKDVQQAMSRMKPGSDCGGLIRQLAALTRLRKAIKI